MSSDRQLSVATTDVDAAVVRPPGFGVVELNDRTATDAFRIALHRAVAAGIDKPTSEVVWIDGDSELLVRPLQARLLLRDALVLVGLPVSTEQSGDAEIVVAFAVGVPGLVMATESRPRGPAAIVTRWGEALIAAAWEALMAVATNSAASAGTDAGPRLPIELRVKPGSLGIVTQTAGTTVEETF